MELERQNATLVAEVQALKLQAQSFERRLAALEGREEMPQGNQAGVLSPSTAATDLPAPGPTLVSAPQTQPPSDDDVWTVSSERLEMYRRAFLKADRNADGFCEPVEVKEVLDRAGLPNIDDARSIWLLTDIKQRGRLNFAEFSCAMYIAFRRAKEGAPLPTQLPQQLLDLASSNMSAGVLQQDASSITPSPQVSTAVPMVQQQPHQPMTQPVSDDAWTVSSERLDMYRNAFLKVDRNADGFCEQSEVNEVLDRAGLPDSSDAGSIFLLADVKQRGRLNFAEFACAMFIAFRRGKQNVPLPSQLPQQLLDLASSTITAGAPPEQEMTSSPMSSSPVGHLDYATSLEQPPVTVQSNAGTAAAATATAAPLPATTLPAFFETDSSAPADPFDEAISVKDLKARLKQHGADFTGLAEKSELLALLRRVEAANKEMPSPQPTSSGPCSAPRPYPALSPTASAKQSDDPFAGLM